VRICAASATVLPALAGIPYPISTRVNSVKNEEPSLIEPAA
jgi:hypothetical protein